MVGIILCIIGFYINSELKEDEIVVEKGHIAVFALISFITGIVLIATEGIWAVAFLLPYLIIRFYMNKKKLGNMATKVTWCEFCIGTGLGMAAVLVAIWLLVCYMLNRSDK